MPNDFFLTLHSYAIYRQGSYLRDKMPNDLCLTYSPSTPHCQDSDLILDGSGQFS